EDRARELRPEDLCAEFSKAVKLSQEHAVASQLLHSTLEQLSAAYLPHVPHLTQAQHCTIPLWACAKVDYWRGDLTNSLLQRLGQDDCGLLKQATGQTHGMLWWSLSKAPRQELAAGDGGVLHGSAACILRMPAQQLDSQACSNTLLACARLQHRHAPLLHHLTSCLVQQPDASCQALANSLYALGELAEGCGHKPRDQDLRKLAAAVLARLQQQQQQQQQHKKPARQQPQVQDGNKASANTHVFTEPALANMLLGFAKLGVSSKERKLTGCRGQPAAAGRAKAQLQGLIRTSHAGAAGDEYTAAAAVQQTCSELHLRLQHPVHAQAFVPQHLANTLWALERLRPPDSEALVQALADECRRRRFAGFSAHDISIVISAHAKMGFGEASAHYTGPQPWYAAAAKAAAASDCMQAGIGDWCALWDAFARVRHRPAPDLLRLMVQSEEELKALCSSSHAQQCSNLLWALANLGLYEQRLVDALVGRLGERLMLGKRKQRELLSNMALVNSLWALAVMGPQVLSRHSG
ncbi:hypothetical protein Agub_g6575, partial [Astrephomene gubernaculifera]